MEKRVWESECFFWVEEKEYMRWEETKLKLDYFSNLYLE